MAAIIIGTAGHIDHGKSSLVKALTGTDPDRLAEEQERGMTIDLGFAFLNETVAFIDVPGHERFVKNMVAGASTIDYAMLVVAADDSVMPQTREHLDILSLLQLKQGLIVINKCDLVDKELLTLVEQDLAEHVRGTFLQDAPIFKVSAITGQGIKELREFLLQLPEHIQRRYDRGIFWMPVDRSFTMKGFGTIVTGSVLSGHAATGDTLDLWPAGKKVKIRSLQSHGKIINEIGMGHRAAINLPNIAKDEVGRGDVLVTPDQCTASKVLDARLSLLADSVRPLRQRHRVRLHLGTAEIMARVKLLEHHTLLPGQSAYVQMLLENEAVALRHDPFVIRQYSPAITIGGGIILDTNPQPHRRGDAKVLHQLKQLEEKDPSELVLASLQHHDGEWPLMPDIRVWTGMDEVDLAEILQALAEQKKIITVGSGARKAFLSSHGVAHVQNLVLAALRQFHAREPYRPGLNKAELRVASGEKVSSKVFEWILAGLIENRIIRDEAGILRLFEHRIELQANDKALADNLLQILQESPFSPPNESELVSRTGQSGSEVRRIINALQAMGHIIRLEGDLYFTSKTVTEMLQRLRQFAVNETEISVGGFRELLGTTRKFAVPLLGYLDQKGITERMDDVRIINRSMLEKSDTPD
jgi:selenocysteine-specific elongation factor